MSNLKAVKTLIRNKLGSNKNWEDTHLWFHEKGVTIDIQGDYYFMSSDKHGHTSELTDFCNSIIYKNSELVCFHGTAQKKSTLSEMKTAEKFIWNKDTIFIEYLQGKETYMFFDKFDQKWVFSDDRKVNSPYRKLIEDRIYNIMSLDPSFTYCLKIVETGKNPGIFLETMYSLDTLQEVPWKDVYRNALAVKMLHPDIYEFKSFDLLEENDFPVYVRDMSATQVLLETI